MTDFPDEGHAAQPPAGVQRAVARAVVAVADQSRGEYVFVDEWDVAAPTEAVFDALADARTYPDWWKPVYETVEADGPPAVGQVSRQHFKGRLPSTSTRPRRSSGSSRRAWSRATWRATCAEAGSGR